MNKSERYFNELPEFKLVPDEYQKRINNFFTEDRHYFVDPSDILSAFTGRANSYSAFNDIDEVVEYSKSNKIVNILACKLPFSDTDRLGEWMENVYMMSDIDHMEGTDIAVLSHVINLEHDLPEEWYLVGT